MMLRKKKEGPVKGCLVPILALLGFILACYLFCFVLYLLNIPFFTPGVTTPEGGMILLPFVA
jgi:hypothetical protein